MDKLTIIFFIILVIATFIKIYVEIKKIGLRKYIINCIVYAEKNFIYGKNQEKFNYVYDKVYDIIPKMLKPFFTKKKTKKFIQMIFDEIKEALNTKKKTK